MALESKQVDLDQNLTFSIKSFLNDGETLAAATAMEILSVTLIRDKVETNWPTAAGTIVIDQNADTPNGHYFGSLDVANFESALEDDDNVEIVGTITNASGTSPFVRVFDIQDPNADNLYTLRLINDPVGVPGDASPRPGLEVEFLDKEGNPVPDTFSIDLPAVALYRGSTDLEIVGAEAFTDVFEFNSVTQTWFSESGLFIDEDDNRVNSEDGDRVLLRIRGSDPGNATLVTRAFSLRIRRQVVNGPVIL